MLRLVGGEAARGLDLAAPVVRARRYNAEQANEPTDGTWDDLSLEPIAYHSAIYDPVRDRMVVFGGFDGLGNLHNDVWVLSLAGAPTWSLLST
jgi:hypothetical protein